MNVVSYTTPSSRTPVLQFLYTKTTESNKDQLFKICMNGQVAAINKWLRKHPGLIDFSSQEGVTPLMLSFKRGGEIYKLILENSSPEVIHKVDDLGRNALHYACAVNSVPGVTELFRDYKLEILVDSMGYVAVEYATDPVIDDLIHDASQKRLDNDGLILRKLWKAARGDYQKMLDLSIKYGIKGLRANQLGDFKARNGDEISKMTPKKFDALKKERRKNIQNLDIRKEISQHFLSNPPASVDEAIGYVWGKYGSKPTEASMKGLLEYVDKKRAATLS